VAIPAVALVAAFALTGSASAVGTDRSEPPLSRAAAPWPASDRPMARARAADLEPARIEHLDFHVHSHLDVFVDGEPQLVPLGIGLRVSDLVRRTIDGQKFVGFFGEGPCDRVCVSPLHTHDESGVIHTESKRSTPNTLKQFFTQWGVRLTDQCVGGYCSPETPIAVYLDGEKFEGDIRKIELTDQLEIAIAIGTPPETIPSEGDFSTA
jgi:hypothetical protein